LDQDVRVPAKSTIHAVLHRHGLVKALGRPRSRATGTPLSAGSLANALWCVDFKGEFKLGNGQYCYPLTVTDCQRRSKSDPLSHLIAEVNLTHPGLLRLRCSVA
jgi:transposase InsO family protein